MVVIYDKNKSGNLMVNFFLNSIIVIPTFYILSFSEIENWLSKKLLQINCYRFWVKVKPKDREVFALSNLIALSVIYSNTKGR